MKTINSRRIREKKILEWIQKQMGEAFKKFIGKLDQDDGDLKDPILINGQK